MAHAFCPMLVVVTGETKDSGFLPGQNYVTVNGKKCPLGHCFNLELPLGHCQLEVSAPHPHTIHRFTLDVKEGELYRLTLTVDASRNIVDASGEVDSDRSDTIGLYDMMCQQAIENRAKIEQWRRTSAPASAPVQTPSATSAESSAGSGSKGGKLIGWGLVALFFIIGIIGCCSGSIEMSNIGIYIVGTVIGLLMFVLGIRRRNA